MLSALCKRGFLESAPWVFGQSSLPGGYSKLTDSLSVGVINSLQPGFHYAFNSILDSYEKKDTESLKQCLEKSLFSYVQKGFSELSEKNIEFKRLHMNDAILIPLSFTLHSGIDINRSNNPPLKNIKTFQLSDENSNGLMSSMEKMMGNFMNAETKSLLKNSKIYIHNNTCLNFIASVEVGFTGPNFLGLFKNEEELTKQYNTNCFHIFKFESEIYRSENTKSLADRFGLIGKLSNLKHLDFFSNEWVLCDIDNQLGGNPLVKD